jgi:hypothetical protein
MRGTGRRWRGRRGRGGSLDQTMPLSTQHLRNYPLSFLRAKSDFRGKTYRTSTLGLIRHARLRRRPKGHRTPSLHFQRLDGEEEVRGVGATHGVWACVVENGAELNAWSFLLYCIRVVLVVR